MKVLIRSGTNTASENIIDVYLVHDEDDAAIEGYTHRPDGYTEDYQKLFHDFVTSIYNYMQSLERKNKIKLVHEMKRKDGNIDELGYRESTRLLTPESYYLPFHVITIKGRPTTAASHLMTLRISTHPPKVRLGEVLFSYRILPEDWKDKHEFMRHQDAIKGLLQGEISRKIKELRNQ